MFGHGQDQPTGRALRLAGYALAHSAFSLCELPQGNLVPFAFFRKFNIFAPKLELTRYLAPTLEESVAAGRNEIATRKLKSQCWALAFETFVHQNGQKVDALTIETGDKKLPFHFAVLQAFRPFSSGAFRLLGSPAYILGDISGRTVDADLAARFTRAVREGTRHHPMAMARWQEWGAAW